MQPPVHRFREGPCEPPGRAREARASLERGASASEPSVFFAAAPEVRPSEPDRENDSTTSPRPPWSTPIARAHALLIVGLVDVLLRVGVEPVHRITVSPTRSRRRPSPEAATIQITRGSGYQRRVREARPDQRDRDGEPRRGAACRPRETPRGEHVVSHHGVVDGDGFTSRQSWSRRTPRARSRPRHHELTAIPSSRGPSA